MKAVSDLRRCVEEEEAVGSRSDWLDGLPAGCLALLWAALGCEAFYLICDCESSKERDLCV